MPLGSCPSAKIDYFRDKSAQNQANRDVVYSGILDICRKSFWAINDALCYLPPGTRPNQVYYGDRMYFLGYWERKQSSELFE